MLTEHTKNCFPIFSVISRLCTISCYVGFFLYDYAHLAFLSILVLIYRKHVHGWKWKDSWAYGHHEVPSRDHGMLDTHKLTGAYRAVDNYRAYLYESAENRKSRGQEASVTNTKCFVIIFSSAPIDKSQESSLRQGLPVRYAAATVAAIAAAKNFSARPQIILAEREKGDDHVSKSESLARRTSQIIGVIRLLHIIKDDQFSINI